MLLGALAVVVLPKYLSVEQYGYYQLYLLYVGFSAMLALGLPESVYLAIGGKRESKLTTGDVKCQFLFLAVFDTIIYVAIAIYLIFNCDDVNKLAALLWVCVSGLINCVRNYPLFILQSTGKIREYAISVIIERLISMVPIIVMVCLGFADMTSLLGFDVLGRLVSLVYVAFVFRKVELRAFLPEKSIKFNPRHLISSMAPGLQLMVASYASTIIVGVIRVGIEQSWDFIIFAQISLVISIANMMTRLINAVAIPVFPALKDLDIEKTRSLYSKVSVGITSAFLVLYLFMQPAIGLLNWWIPAYAQALGFALLIMPICLFESKTAVLVMSLCKSFREERFLLLLNLGSIVCSIVVAIVSPLISNNIGILLLLFVAILGLRCIVGEVFLYRKYHFSSQGMLLWDICTASFFCFIWYLASTYSAIASALVLITFILFNRNSIRTFSIHRYR